MGKARFVRYDAIADKHDDTGLAIPAPARTAPPREHRSTLDGPSTRLYLCRCGCAWSITRMPTRQFLQEHMNCICGQLLLQWSECADYLFESIDAGDSLEQ